MADTDRCEQCGAKATGTRAGPAIGVCDRWSGCDNPLLRETELIRLRLKLMAAENEIVRLREQQVDFYVDMLREGKLP